MDVMILVNKLNNFSATDDALAYRARRVLYIACVMCSQPVELRRCCSYLNNIVNFNDYSLRNNEEQMKNNNTTMNI